VRGIREKKRKIARKARQRRGESLDDASATSSRLVTVATSGPRTTSTAGFAFCRFCILFVVDDFLRFDAHVHNIGCRVAESTVC
jgi:hypothetical protein